MASSASNKIAYLLAKKIVDFSTDVFKIILMAEGFTFNKDTHHCYADVSASELATGYGYTQNSKVLTDVSVTENDTDDRCEVKWSNPSWLASGGSIGPTVGAIVFDDTVTTPTADPIVGYINFGGPQTQADGGQATIANVEFRLNVTS